MHLLRTGVSCTGFCSTEVASFLLGFWSGVDDPELEYKCKQTEYNTTHKNTHII